MSSADFAAAQQRLHARRAQREREYRAALSAQHNAAHQQRVATLPYPLNRLGGAGLALWDAVKGREGTGPAFRVGQVDAELLDEELLQLLKGQVGEGLRCFGSHLAEEYKPEILLALRAVLFKLSIWDHNASYGAALQGLRYTDVSSSRSRRHRSKATTAPDNYRDDGDDPSRPAPQRWQKTVYGLVTVGGRYAWSKWEDYLINRSTDSYEQPSSSSSSAIHLAERLTAAASATHSAAAFASFLVFLANGRYRTLLDRALGLRLAPAAASVSREVSFEYLNRQLVWHAFTEFLLFLLPLVGVARWRRLLGRVWRRARASVASAVAFGRRGKSAGAADDEDEDELAGKAGELGFLPERTCAICYSDQQNSAGGGEQQAMAQSSAGGSGVVGSAATDITNPYQAVPCGCVYCFVCLAQKIEAEEGEGWTCLRCGDVVKACRAWEGDVIVEQQQQQQQQQTGGGGGGRPGSSGEGNGGGKSVGFAKHEEEGYYDDNEKKSLRQVSPVPTVGGDEGAMLSADPQTERSLLEGSRALTESEEWARASRIVEEGSSRGGSGSSSSSNGSGDEQSEEIDEEEDEIEFEE